MEHNDYINRISELRRMWRRIMLSIIDIGTVEEIP